MSPISSALTSTADDSGIDDILQWLAGAPEILDDAHVDSLFEQLTLLRQTPLPTPQRVRLLDLIFPRIESLIEHQHTSLRDLPLPISRRLRHRIRALLDLLEILAQDYLNTLALVVVSSLTRPSQIERVQAGLFLIHNADKLPIRPPFRGD